MVTFTQALSWLVAAGKTNNWGPETLHFRSTLCVIEAWSRSQSLLCCLKMDTQHGAMDVILPCCWSCARTSVTFTQLFPFSSLESVTTGKTRNRGQRRSFSLDCLRHRGDVHPVLSALSVTTGKTRNGNRRRYTRLRCALCCRSTHIIVLVTSTQLFRSSLQESTQPPPLHFFSWNF